MGARENGEERDDRSSDVDQDGKQGKEVESDYEPGRDSLSSQGSNEDTKVKRVSRVPKKLEKKDSKENSPRMVKSNANRQTHSKLQYMSSNNSRSLKPNKAGNTVKTVEVRKPQTVKVPSRPSSEVSEETDDKAIEGRAIDGKAIEGRNIEDKAKEEAKEIDVLDEAPNCDQSTGTDDEIADTEGNVVDDDKSIAYEKTQQLESKIAYEKTQELESKIDKLEQELREVAALEVSLYSVAPEHGSSSHKLHTPARHLSRLYIHASKFWSSDKRASVAKSTISGLVLVAKSCGNDVSRLAFWLSNAVVLREIIAQTFGTSRQMSLVLKAFNTNGNAKKHDGKSMPTRWKNSSNGKQTKLAAMPLPDDWQETGTLLAALEKIESWIFSRIVESVWWQVLTSHMQTLVEDLSTPKAGRLSGPALGDQQQGTFSINLWKSAFHDAFSRICPPRAGGHDCGCLSVLAKLVMEQCVARLDVAMFNAILRESANEMPTDPISDPIVDSKVLPIPAGDLSFGSGAQLKNSIGNWSRWLTDTFGMNADDSDKDGRDALNDEDDDRRDAAESTSFQLLNELSDLLMLPKDMLLEKSIRKEVCPSIGLTLVTRVLCNFTPDEFCPDPVPGMVLEELNSESLLEHFTEKDVISTFPCTAAPAVYCAPLLPDAAEKVADTGGNAELDRRASTIQRRGHTSDDNLDDLDCPLASLIDRSFPPSPSNDTAHFITQKGASMANARYELLREVWSERP